MDEREQGIAHGQNVEQAFPLADFFIESGVNRDDLEKEVQRLVDLIFRDPFITPTRDEMAMYHAFVASLRSAAPGRQVGAAVVDGDGSILATGTNDVARAGGGLYWTEDPHDAREHVGRTDLGDIFQQQLLADLVDRMKRAGWLRDEFEARATNQLVTDAVTDEDSDGKLAVGEGV